VEGEGLGKGFEEVEFTEAAGTGEEGSFESGSEVVGFVVSTGGGGNSVERDREGGGELSSCEGGERRRDESAEGEVGRDSPSFAFVLGSSGTIGEVGAGERRSGVGSRSSEADSTGEGERGAIESVEPGTASCGGTSTEG